MICHFPKYSGTFSIGASYVICVPRDTFWEPQFPDANEGEHSENCYGAKDEFLILCVHLDLFPLSSLGLSGCLHFWS